MEWQLTANRYVPCTKHWSPALHVLSSLMKRSCWFKPQQLWCWSQLHPCWQLWSMDRRLCSEWRVVLIQDQVLDQSPGKPAPMSPAPFDLPLVPYPEGRVLFQGIWSVCKATGKGFFCIGEIKGWILARGKTTEAKVSGCMWFFPVHIHLGPCWLIPIPSRPLQPKNQPHTLSHSHRERSMVLTPCGINFGSASLG